MEIESNGLVLEKSRTYSAGDFGETEGNAGEFAKFVLQKRDWDTIHALITIAKNMGRGKKSIGYSGSKDRLSESVQLASIYGVDPAQLMGLRMKDVSINGAWRSSTPVELGKNLGNSFYTVIRGCTDPENAEKTIEALDGLMPNYYDRQRFGIRMNNADIGMCIMHGEFEEAVSKFLTDTKFERNAASVEARKRLAEDMDFKAARDYFPRQLRNERMVIEYMAQYNNYANAIRKIPRGLLIMFIHSVQSLIFNAALERRIKEGDMGSEQHCAKNFYGFPNMDSLGREGSFPVAPLIGYESDVGKMDEYEKEVIEEAGLDVSDFRIKSMPELSMRGSLRAILAPVKDLSLSSDEDKKAAILRFSIPAGSYATILLNEITKSDDFSLRLPFIE